MNDALLSPSVGAAFWAGSLAFLSFSAKKLKEETDERTIPLMGVLGAFIFAGQMINFSIPATGSSGHLGGGMILAIALGPYAAFLVISSVLTVQSLFFADGGLLALGCNIWNLGVYPCFVAYPLIYRPLTGNTARSGRIAAASLFSAVVGLQLGALSVVVQTLLSGKSDLSFRAFAFLMSFIHLAIGLVEGFITAGVINYIRSVRPEILRHHPDAGSGLRVASLRRSFMAFLLIAFVTAGFLSWFASEKPDGLEWSIEKSRAETGTRSPGNAIVKVLETLQKKTSFLPDYGFRKKNEVISSDGDISNNEPLKVSKTETSVAGVVGSLIVILFVALIAAMIKIVRKTKSGTH